MNEISVIYHRSDFDGIFCREIARKFLPTAELIGWEYGDPTPAIPLENTLYILDLSVPDLMNHPGLIWIDHHKSAIEKYPTSITGYRIDGVAACRITWQWFFNLDITLPTKQDYVDRLVDEPLAVRLAGEYDIWDKRDPNAELFQYGLRSEEVDFQKLFENNVYVEKLLQQGKVLQYAKNNENKSIITSQSFEMTWENTRFLCCNHARFNSLLFDAKVDKDKHDGLLGFCWDGVKWKISLYHTPFNKEIDLSLIAIKYGGGGHKGACGFTCKELPFKLG